MKDKDKLKLLQRVGNDIVDRYADFKADTMTTPLSLEHTVKALEIILVGMSARNTPVMAKNPVGHGEQEKPGL